MKADAIQRYRLAKQIVSTTMDLPKPERNAWIARECGDDQALRREVMWLLEAAESEPATDIPEGWTHLHQAAPLAAEGTQFESSAPSNYRVLRRIGEGGMGVVYFAERSVGDARQHVALKFLNAAGRSDILLRRFNLERRILASLNHPNIAHMMDSGATAEGRPYIALEFVEGQPIDCWCDAHALSLRERVELFLKVCAAVAYAHQHLVLHRDLKPTNILVGIDGEPKLLDFGISRLLDETHPGLTETGQRAFTMAYASPEQIENRELSTAVDVWALGVVLYKLVCGGMPFGGLEHTHLISAAIVSGQITPPSRQYESFTPPATGSADAPRRRFGRRRKQVPRDIDAIIMKALRRDPNQRYASVTDMAADLRRFLAARPVTARRGHRLYAARRFAWRHRFGLAVSATIVALLVGGLIMRDHQLRRVEIERNKAQALADFMNGLFKSADPFNTSGAEVTARTLLERGAERLRTRSDLDPLTKSSMLLSVAQAYNGLYAGKAAIPLLKRAQALLPDTAPPRDRLAILEALGDAYSINGDYAEAIRADAEALHLLQGMPDTNRQEQLTEQVSLARDEALLGNVPAKQTIETLSRLRQKLRSGEVSGDQQLLDRIDARIANAYQQSGDSKAALRVMRDRVKQAEQNFGESDPRTLYDRWHLARALVADNPQEAVHMLQAVLPGFIKTEGTHSKTWALMLNDLSVAQSAAGQNEAAIATLKRARTAAHALGGVSDNYYLILSGNLATYLSEQGHYDEAEAVLNEVLPTLHEQAGEGGIHRAAYAFALTGLGNIQWKRNQYDKAAKSYAAAKSALGSDAQNYFVVYRGVLDGIAKSRIHAGQLDAAAEVLAELQRASAAAHVPADSGNTVRLHVLQAQLAFAKHDYASAARIAADGLAAASPGLGDCRESVRELRALQSGSLAKLGRNGGTKSVVCSKIDAREGR